MSCCPFKQCRHKAVTKLASATRGSRYFLIQVVAVRVISILATTECSQGHLYFFMAALTEESLQQHDAELEDCPQVRSSHGFTGAAATQEGLRTCTQLERPCCRLRLVPGAQQQPDSALAEAGQGAQRPRGLRSFWQSQARSRAAQFQRRQMVS